MTNPPDQGKGQTEPRISVVVVHWRDELALARLLGSIEPSPRVEWLVIDNSRSAEPPPALEGVRWVQPPDNLGFGGGVNLGVRCARGEWLLVLNPDARPLPGALKHLVEETDKRPQAAGLVPRLLSEDGRGQWNWQLRGLPRPWQLLLQALFIDRVNRPDDEPGAEQTIEQPAAAALLLRRAALESIAGFDPRYQPAWFEDVDLAARLFAEGQKLLYCPKAEFAHGMGGSVSPLGYDRFLRAYYRNLRRYMERHAQPWHRLLPPLLVFGMLSRLLLLPIRKPRRASSRGVAARGLLWVLSDALTHSGRLR